MTVLLIKYGFMLVLAALVVQRSTAVEFVCPDDAGIINAQRDFSAKGGGVTDHTRAITNAIIRSLSEDRYTPEFIYLPNGTYIVSDTIQNRVPKVPNKRYWGNGWLVGIALVGQSGDGTVIKLRDRCPGYDDPDHLKPVIRAASEMQGRKAYDEQPEGYGNCAFRNSIINLTVDTGRGNPGAVGVVCRDPAVISTT